MQTDGHECAQCGKAVPGNVWVPGLCCVGGGIFACCAACGIKWADANCVPGTKVEECVAGEQFDTFGVIHTVNNAKPARPA